MGTSGRRPENPGPTHACRKDTLLLAADLPDLVGAGIKIEELVGAAKERVDD